MIDPNLLKSIGWSDELIAAASDMAAAIGDPVATPAVDVVSEIIVQGSASGSMRIDVSGPPVAQAHLRVAPR
jgi:hypothetical protein